MNILISACLLGIKCRYDLKSKPSPDALKLRYKHNLIPICPECYGGLPSPRFPSEINGERVFSKDGTDVTEQYKRGAQAALELAKILNCTVAVLKEKSPSCGSGKIHNGLFDGGLIDGDRITAALLKQHGITVIGESEIRSYFGDL